VIFPRQRLVAYPPMKFRHIDGTQGAGLVARKWQDWRADVCLLLDPKTTSRRNSVTRRTCRRVRPHLRRWRRGRGTTIRTMEEDATRDVVVSQGVV